MGTEIRIVALWLWLGLGCGSLVFAQGVDVDGGTRLEDASEPLRLFQNRGPREIVPPAPDPSEQPTYADPQGRLEILIDRKHGYLKSLRFPKLFEEADARSIDRYIVLDGVSSSELDDEVTRFEDLTDADRPHIVVECLNRQSGIAIRKIYQIDAAHHEVIKRVEIDSPSEKILNIVSVTVLSDEARAGGYYYQYIGHTGNRYCTFPTAAIPESFFVNGRNMQSGLCTVTRPDIDFTYGEVQLTINDVPEYMSVPADDYPNTGWIEAMVTREGWQLPRGNWLQLGPGKGLQTKSWLYSATRGTHLMWHAKYHKRYFSPAFAPERRLDRGIDCAFDTSFLWPHAAVKYKDGALELIEGDLEQYLAGENKRWENEPIHYTGPAGEPLWPQHLALFDAIYAGFETLDLDPRAWATCGLAETMYTMGDFLADHMWLAPNSRAAAKDMMKVSMEEYFGFVRALQLRWPRFKLFNYERGGYYAHTDTIQEHPEFAFRTVYRGDTGVVDHYSPIWKFYWAQMTDKYLELQKEGVSLYDDWAVPGAAVAKLPDGKTIYQSYESCLVAMKKMARTLRDAGGFFYVNQPSGAFADFGYIEGGSWDTDTQVEWRYWADRLQLYKLHEFRPNTVVALDMMCDEFIHQCLLYNFVPGIRNRVGVATAQSWAPRELIRVRWNLREASMAPVPLRPVPWETPGSPLETSVMTLPGTVYLAAYNHVTNDHTADLTVDLHPVIDRKPHAIWRVDVTKGPWAGLVTPQGTEPHVPIGDGSAARVGYKYEVAETEFTPYHAAVWDDLRLKLTAVEISKRQSTYFFLATVPAVVRSVEGREVLWPVSSQPHIRITHHTDGALLVQSDYTEVILALSPDWLTEDAGTEAQDKKTGWPTLTVLPGTWRLMPDGRLLYESRSPDPLPDSAALPGGGMSPIAIGTPIAGLEKLGSEHVLTLQNGINGYDGQSNDQINTGQWGNEGNLVPGADGIFIYGNGEAKRYSRLLIRFNLEGRLPPGATVRQAALVLHASQEAAGGNQLVKGYPALQPWTDGKTWWKNWGSGGTDPGYVDETPACSETVGTVGNSHFVLDPAVVQGWLDQPGTNHGLLLKNIQDDSGFHWWAHGDKEEHPPQLVIGYNL
jgi:hypothetical protein